MPEARATRSSALSSVRSSASASARGTAVATVRSDRRSISVMGLNGATGRSEHPRDRLRRPADPRAHARPQPQLPADLSDLGCLRCPDTCVRDVLTHHMMRMRGLEPPPGFPDTDLNRARLPIPPHPRVGEEANIAPAVEQLRRWKRPWPEARVVGSLSPTRSGRFASLDPVNRAPLSSRGLGRRPLMAETRVRIPVAVLTNALQLASFSSFQRPVCAKECAGQARRSVRPDEGSAILIGRCPRRSRGPACCRTKLARALSLACCVPPPAFPLCGGSDRFPAHLSALTGSEPLSEPYLGEGSPYDAGESSGTRPCWPIGRDGSGGNGGVLRARAVGAGF
jgi:hypothetical protein